MKPKKNTQVTQSFEVTKYLKEAKPAKSKIEVVAEAPFQILVNESSIAGIMLTPKHLEEFLVGFLIGQGIASNINHIEKILVEPEKGLLWAQVKELGVINLKKSLITSGCAGGITFEKFDDLPLSRESGKYLSQLNKSNWSDISIVTGLMREMITKGKIYPKAGGVHSACLASCEDGIIFQTEDIGRHNAIDKVIGHLVQKGINPDGKMILTTGRLSFEAIPKVARAKVGIIGSRSTPSNLAIELAKKLNITLFGYIRSNQMSAYT